MTLKKLLKPRGKRLAVSHARESLGLSERKACLLVNILASVYRYRLKMGNDDNLRQRLRELAGQRKRFGSPRLHIMLKREGLVINHKQTERILVLARAFPELSSRELALRIIDTEGLYVSESTIFRALKREGLIKPAEIVGFKAGKEYHRKTKRANELWATDCSHIKVIDWGWYYLVTVMDDYSRFILAWELKSDMASNSLIDVVQKAVDATGMTDVPVEDRTMLLSDNGPGYISRQFGDYLSLVGIRHILASPYHPQTNGKIERYHRTIKGELILMPYGMPGELEEAIRAFIEHYNYRRYHEGLGNVTPYDVYTGRYLEIIQKRKEVKSRTLQLRRDYNKTVREQGSGF